MKANKLESKFLKVILGAYSYELGPVMPPGTDPNNVPEEKIAIYFLSDGWTQARVTSLLSSPNGNHLAIFEIEQGYDVSKWKTAGLRNLGCVDASAPCTTDVRTAISERCRITTSTTFEVLALLLLPS